MKFKMLNGREKYKNITNRKISWDEPSRSIMQSEVKKFLKKYWIYDLVYEEMPVIGTKMSLDIVNYTQKIAVEVHGKQHSQFVKHFHGNRNNFRRQMNRDSLKEEWCTINGFKYVDIYPADMKELSKQWFEKEFDIHL